MTTTDDRTSDGPATDRAVTTPAHGGYARSGRVALTFGALGVVFGDIGTSPLYAMHEVFAGPHPMTPDPGRVYGVLSLVFWALMIIVTLKYIVFVMRANNEGEGGIMALISLVMRAAMKSPGGKLGLVALGIFGASLFYGDGMITPAISVLSAVEGLEIATPGAADYVIPIALVILTGLFAIQRLGTGADNRSRTAGFSLLCRACGRLRLCRAAEAADPDFRQLTDANSGASAFIAKNPCNSPCFGRVY